MRHVATEPVIGPEHGEDPQFDEAVLRGQIVVLSKATLENGKRVRLCRTKGVTYRKPVIGADGA